ncbi:MAG: DUF4974 domain-containing protein [Terrimonas sp.]|nr:DUF4974 domain-containing protein [Terrimonas sp.]
MSQEKFWILFSKKLSKEASAEELLELEELIHQHPEWQYAIQNLEDLWSLDPVKDMHEEEDAYLLHLQRMNDASFFEDQPENLPVSDYFPDENRGRRIRLKWIMAAAVFIGLIITGFSIFHNKVNAKGATDVKQGDISEISTRLGSKSKVQLPDGSVVWLNAGSKLTYDKEFGQAIREVSLTGEGFFDVAKNKEKPFIIHTRAIDIKVLGTAFNVKAYPEDKTTETSLIRGSIEVSVRNRPNEKIILSPNEKLVVRNRDIVAPRIKEEKVDLKPEISINQLRRSPIDSTIAETQWVENRLVFRDESFKDLAVSFERWYNIKITISDSELEEARFSGTFSNETIEQALQALMITKSFRYEINSDQIIIYK